jgi:hypothetical protein
MNLVPLSSLFVIRYGHSLELNRLHRIAPDAGGIAFVSRKMGGNGISAYVSPIDGIDPAPAGELTCALSGNGVLSTFFQCRPFYTAFHVARLSPMTEMSVEQLLYYCACIWANRFRYSYGRQANRTLKDLLIPDLTSIPGWVTEVDVGMFDGANLAIHQETADLKDRSWRTFSISDLFTLKKGRRLTKAQIQTRPGDIPFIGAIDSNNGVSGKVNAAIHEAGTLTVIYNGAGVADTFYQPVAFWASDDVNVLYPKFAMTPAIALFVATIIREEKYRFSYGRKWHLERMNNSEIHLPVDDQGRPDWDFMETYIQSLPFSSQIQ